MKTPEKIYYKIEFIFALCMIITILIVGKSLNNRIIQADKSVDSQSTSMIQTVSATKTEESNSIEQSSHAEKQEPKEEKLSVSEPQVKKESSELKYYDVPLSTDVQDTIFTECKTKKVPQDLVIALIGVESHYNPKCISKTNDYGLMQINICHKESLKKDLQITDLLDSKQNIKAGVHMLSWIVNKYSNINQALMVYNSGEFGAQKLWKQGIYSTAYSRKVIAQLNEIKKST